MATSTLDPAQRARVVDVIDRALRAAAPHAISPEATDRPGGLGDLYLHVDELVQIARRSKAQVPEAYLSQILEDVCSKCARQDVSSFCPLRQRGTCVLYANAGVVVEAVASALRELHDAEYEAEHAPAAPEELTGPAAAGSAATVVFRRILIAADTDESSGAAVTLGLQLAADLNAQVALVHVLPPLLRFTTESTDASRRVQDSDRDRAAELIREFRNRTAGRPGAAEFLPEGYPAEQIVGVARRWGADLIVVGTHGSGRLTSFLLGSTTQSVIRDAPCAVLVVPPQP